MKYFSHYIWESGSEGKANPVSLVLQQVKYGGKHHLFACICEAEECSEGGIYTGGYVTTSLVEWFHDQYLQLWYKKPMGEKLQRALKKELGKMEEALVVYAGEKETYVKYHMLGILMCEHDFLCFAKGTPKGYLFNHRFNRKQRIPWMDRLFTRQVYEKEERDEVRFAFGYLQKGVGVLLCGSRFDAYISAEEMIEVLLHPWDNEEQIQKSLRELWKENQIRGGEKDGAAIYVTIP